MKKILLSTMLGLMSTMSLFAYTTITKSGDITTSETWTCDKQYLLNGFVYVTAGNTLTINAGTIVKGDLDSKGALIVERGAKIRIMGTATSPVVFTSNQSAGTRSFGDWGGLIICGYAPANWYNDTNHIVEGGPRSKYGGSMVNDNSGEIHYLRIEFAGIPFSPNNEVNGLSLYSVGKLTQLDHIQVSYSGDDSYEWFGGNVNSKYLVAYNTWDDDFDTDCGYNGLNQFCVALRFPYSADQSGSKAFESDSYQGNTAGLSTTTGTNDTNNLTKCVFSNCTVIGPVVNPSSSLYDRQFVAGVHVRRGSGISILNSIIAGWPCGILVDEPEAAYTSTVANIGNNILQFRNNVIAGTYTGYTSGTANRNIAFVRGDAARSLTPTSPNADTISFSAGGQDWNTLTGYSGPYSWLLSSANHNRAYTYTSDLRLQNPYFLSNPSFIPTSTSPIIYSDVRFPSWSARDTFNNRMPINFDTTSPATYNVPGVSSDRSSNLAPDFATTRAANGFFTNVNYIGAFADTPSTNDNWMRGWCNFDPVNEDYDRVCYTTAITTTTSPSFTNAKVFPNPAKDKATLLVDIKKTGSVKIAVLDMSGREVKVVFNGEVTTTGDVPFEFNTTDLANGMYIMSIQGANNQKAIRFSIAK